MKEQSLEQRAKKVLDTTSEALSGLAGAVPGIKAAVKTINDREGDIIVTGIGKSGYIGQKIAATLTSLGQKAIFIHSVEAVHGDLGALSEGDTLIAISFSGETKEVVKLVKYAQKHFGVSVIALTKSKNSSLGKLSDVVLEVNVKEEGSPNGLAPMASTTISLVLGDMLAAALVKNTFKDHHYAKFHPGGSLGMKLEMTKNLMRSNIPIVAEKDKFSEILKEINKKKVGATGVVNKAGKIVGIITDGDIRRLLLKDLGVENVQARDFMTKNPKYINETDSLESALVKMEKYKITHLFVVNSLQKPVGVIHIHDIIEGAIVEK